MARRRNLSELLESRFECPVSWDGMSGGQDHRFCDQCRCQVFDFAQMEPRAVRARLEASRGKLCARVTRVDGRLKMLAPPSPPPAAEMPRKTERAPAIATGLFGAWLSLATASVAASADSPALVSTAAADSPDEAAGRATGTPAGFTDEIEMAAAFESEIESVTLGEILVVEAATLRELFADSDLIFAGQVGSSEILSVDEGIAEVRTELRVARRFKGGVRDRFVTYRHSLPVEAFGPEMTEPLPELTPGAMVMAFLTPAEDEAGRIVYEAVSYDGLRGFAADELAAYSERLEDLAAFDRVAGPEGEPDLASLMEWLVAAAEDPLTRREHTSREILSALVEFENFAADPESGEAAAAPELGAMLTEGQKIRLAAALGATRTMGYADLDLFRLVRQLDPETAGRWLVATLGSGGMPEDGDLLGLLAEFAETLEGTLEETAAEAFLDGAEERLGAIDELLLADASAEGDEAWQRQRQDLARKLFAELAVLLEKRTD